MLEKVSGYVKRYRCAEKFPKNSFFGAGQAVTRLFEREGNSEEVQQFRKFMIEKDGFMETEYLPPGYILRQKNTEASFVVYTEKYVKLNTFTKLRDYLEQNGLEDYSKLFMENYKTLLKPYVKKNNKDQLVHPNNWHRKETSIKSEIKNEADDGVDNEEEDEEIDLSDSEFEEMNLDSSFDDSLAKNTKLKNTSDQWDDSDNEVDADVDKDNDDDVDNEEVDGDDEAEIDNDDEESIPEELEWCSDTFLPRGWQVNIFKMPSGTPLTRYKSPDENYFGCLPDVLKFLHQSRDEITKNVFKRGLYEDGWEVCSSITLSGEWFSKYSKARGLQYLTPNYEVLNNEEISSRMKELEYPEEDISKFLKDVSEVKWLENSSVPSNWKVADVQEATGGKVRKFLSPGDLEFDSRPEAIKFMIDSREFSNEDITRMQLGMSEDDWMFDENLPVGWFKKRVGEKWHFSTSKFIVLKTNAEVLSHFLQTGASQDVIERFSKATEAPAASNSSSLSSSPITPQTPKTPTSPLLFKSQRRVTVKQEKVDLPCTNENLPQEDDSESLKQKADKIKIKKEKIEVSPSNKRKSPQDEGKRQRHKSDKIKIKKEKIEKNEKSCFPENWRLEIEDDQEVIFNDSGEKFLSRRAAVEFMMKNNFKQVQIDSVWKTLDQEGWVLDPSDMIPKDWRMKQFPDLYDHKYITKDMKILHSTEEAHTYINDNENLLSYADKFETWAEELRDKEPEMTWRSDPTLADSWLMCSDLDKQILKFSPTGGRFQSRKDAIDYMIREGQSSSDIFTMWNCLDVEGWVSDEDHLPRGWRWKTREDTCEKIKFLSPMMEVVRSSDKMLEILKNNDDYQDEDVRKFQNWDLDNVF